MDIFKDYSECYDLLYKDKDYKKEAGYIDRLIKRHASLTGKDLIDIGCGTGRHGLWFTNKSYRVLGIDRSSEMIRVAERAAVAAKSDIKFHIADSARFKVGKKFDIAVALFHAMSYQATNSAFLSTLKNIYAHLKNGGIFIFDFWYGPAVLTQKPARKVKIVYDGKSMIKRIAVPKININADTVDINYTINLKNKKNGLNKKIVECHTMRYFFLPELYLMLNMAGFEVIECLKWMSLKEDVSENSWSGVIIAEKN